MILAILACLLAAADLGYANRLLTTEPPPRKLDAIGKRLATTIGEDLTALADAYAETKDERYLERVKLYLKAAAEYEDWKPNYYLTCAQVMNGVSRALEVCGNDFEPEFKAEIQDVLLEKGLKGSFLGWWWYSKDNWTQVCCCAVAYAALEIKDRYPEKAADYLEDAISAVKSAMEAYGPDGCYTEGTAYWGYATDNTERMLAVLQRCNDGDDGGIGEMAGYKESKDWIRGMTGPSGQIFNYADGWRPGAEKDWRAKDFGARVYEGTQQSGYLASRDAYIAMKGGKATINHAHMDAGSFVYDTFKPNGGGVRWVEDPYTEDYGKMERAGLKVWNTKQDSTRWRVFRQGVDSHSVFRIDDGDFEVKGMVRLVKANERLIIADTSELYDGIYERGSRRWELSERGFTLTDEFIDVDEGHEYSFNFTTFAEVSIDGREVILSRDGRRVGIIANRRDGAWAVEDVSTPRAEYDSPNPGMKRVVFRCALENGAVEFVFKELDPFTIEEQVVDHAKRRQVLEERYYRQARDNEWSAAELTRRHITYEFAEGDESDFPEANGEYMIVDLNTGSREYIDEAPEVWGDEYKTDKLVLRLVRAGSFVSSDKIRRYVTRPFYIGVFTLTQRQYEIINGDRPSQGEFMPCAPLVNVYVEQMRGRTLGERWPMTDEVDRDTFFGRLRERSAIRFDLPTETQWELACRAGTDGDFACEANKPNSWGIYDMHGGIWEWCADRGRSCWALLTWEEEMKEDVIEPFGILSGYSRIARGGASHNHRGLQKSCQRAHGYQWNTDGDNGFRVACATKWVSEND